MNVEDLVARRDDLSEQLVWRHLFGESVDDILPEYDEICQMVGSKHNPVWEKTPPRNIPSWPVAEHFCRYPGRRHYYGAIANDGEYQDVHP